jgi:TolB-like protein
VRREGKLFVLEVRLLDPHGQGPAKSTTETMRLLKSLQRNVATCVDRLLPPFIPPILAPEPEPPPPLLVDAPPAPPAPAPPPTVPSRKRVLVMDLKPVGVDGSLVTPLTALVGMEIARHPGFDVMGKDDVSRILSLQAQKSALGCTQDEACMVEISKKLDADLIVSGSVGLVGGSYTLNLTVIDARAMNKTSGAFESAAHPGDLPATVAPCLAKAFQWGSAPAPTGFHLPKGKKLSFAVLDLKPTGLSADTAQNLTQILSVEVKGIEGASVVSREDIAAMLQLSAEKMAVGCADDACMAQIGGALGVDRLITGDAGKLGDTFIINLRLVDVRRGEIENRTSEICSGCPMRSRGAWRSPPARTRRTSTWTRS